MADSMTATLDTAPLVRALTALPERLRVRTMAACEQTAKAAAHEMRSRLARQLGPQATGTTVAGILYEKSYDGEGYVVRTTDTLPPGYRQGELAAGRGKGFRPHQRARWASRQYANEKHVGLYLEKGTKPGQRRNMARTRPRPFFYATLELEAPGHERRIREAMADAAEDVGLGD